MAKTLEDNNVSNVYKKLLFTKEDSAAEGKLYATASNGDDREVTGFASALSLTGLVTAESGVKLGNNIIYASDGGTTITLDASDNVAITGDLIVTGNQIMTGTIGSVAVAISLSG